jgi:hypothetical protein
MTGLCQTKNNTVICNLVEISYFKNNIEEICEMKATKYAVEASEAKQHATPVKKALNTSSVVSTGLFAPKPVDMSNFNRVYESLRPAVSLQALSKK